MNKKDATLLMCCVESLWKPVFLFFLLLQSYDWCHPGRADSEPPLHLTTAAVTDSGDGYSDLNPP